MQTPNTDISIKEQETLEQLILISESIYKQYEKLIDIELDLKKKKIKKKNSNRYQEAKKKLNLILVFEYDCYIELHKNPDNYYKYMQYLDQKYQNGNVLGDYDIIAQNSKDIILRRISKRLDDSSIFYKSFMKDTKDYPKVEFLTDDFTSEEKDKLITQIYDYMETVTEDILVYQQIDKEYSYEFLLNLDKIINEDNIRDITRVKYQMCFLNYYLENCLFDNNYELKGVTYDKEKDRKKLKLKSVDIDTFYQEDAMDQINYILEELMQNSPKGTKLDLLLYDMNLYFNKLNDLQKNKVRNDAYEMFDLDNLNNEVTDECKKIFGPVTSIKVKIKRKKK